MDVYDRGSAKVWLLVILLIIGGIFAHYNYSLTCDEEKIPREVKTEQSVNIYPSESYTRIEGSDGVMQVCHHVNKEFANQKVLVAPTMQVKVEGKKVDTPVYSPPAQYIEPSGGAICNDGSRSYSTGRGTCSWHGGISYYL